MSLFTLKGFQDEVIARKRKLRRFLSGIEKKQPKGLDGATTAIEPEIWKEVNCLSCANCCKVMTPTYTEKDIRRISKHLSITAVDFKRRWLKKERGTGDWVNRSTPCQFLDLQTNYCTIYAVRPADCAGFPHLPKRKMVEYMHVHKQNLEFCPATYRMIEKLMEKFN